MNLFPSSLVIGGSDQDIANILTSINHSTIINNPDIFVLTEYTIAAVRQINKFLSHKPIAHPTKAVLIKNAHNLFHEAQNALLKMLEEPGLDNYFILTTEKHNSLLPTIISRCHLIQFNTTQIIFDQILTIPSSISAKLALSQSLATDKQVTLIYLENQLRLYHQKLTTKPSPDNHKIVNNIIKSISLIKANVDPKTALDFLMLS